ncbi:hypothetical protein KSP39_PZI013876 [Platanthera zijinensis]|uniref:Uncharacterized protein n=1 Tax=Platanthera zijinensis TaxID=2320716 RepID=A0AAP0BD83_9ASPA
MKSVKLGFFVSQSAPLSTSLPLSLMGGVVLQQAASLLAFLAVISAVCNFQPCAARPTLLISKEDTGAGLNVVIVLQTERKLEVSPATASPSAITLEGLYRPLLVNLLPRGRIPSSGPSRGTDGQNY